MNTVPTANIAFRVGQPDSVTGECTSLTCEIAGVITDPAVVYGAVFASLFALVAFAYVQEAREHCRMERRRIADEQDAFREFASRLRALDPVATRPNGLSNEGPNAGSNGRSNAASSDSRASPTSEGSGASASPDASTAQDPTPSPPATPPGGVRTIGGPEGHRSFASDGSLDRVRTAYRETVMSVPHYDEEYGDDLLASVTAELGDDAAAALVASDRLTPGLRAGLLAQTRDARRNRDRLTDAIDVERAALDTAGNRLAPIDRERRALQDHLAGDPRNTGFEAYVDVWHRLDHLEDRCGSVAEDRQDRLANPPMSGVDWAPSFYDYLYTGLSVDHPVLATVGDLVADLRADRTRVERVLTET